MADVHPSLPEFDYIRPTSMAEACRFLADHPGQARPFIGGTDTFVRMRDGVWKDQYLVDVKFLDGANELSFDPNKGLTIGAAVPMNELIRSDDVLGHYPLLAMAARTVAAYQLRNRATVVGNLCNASPAGDTIGACLVYGGWLEVFGPNGQRIEPLATFFSGPGKTVLKPGDIALALHLPVPPPGSAGTYLKLGRNRQSDLAIVGVTALGHPNPDLPSRYQFRLALAAVAPIPLVPTEAESILANSAIDDDLFERAAQAAMDACSPIDDVRGSAEYRRLMVRNLTRRALRDIWSQLK